MNFSVTLNTEIIKLKRSKIFWITLCLFAFIPGMTGLLIYLSWHPELTAKMGLVGTKANMFGENTWTGYFVLLNQLIAAIGMIGYGFVACWVFGREYIEHTVTDMLALPVRRSSIVIAKYVIILLWCILLTLVLYVTSIIIGHIIHIPEWNLNACIHYGTTFFNTAFLTMLMVTPVGFIASYSRGVLAAIGFVILTLIMAQFLAYAGAGPYFPWAIPGIYSMIGEVPDMILFRSSFIILITTSIVGFIGTILWWCYADQQ